MTYGKSDCQGEYAVVHDTIHCDFMLHIGHIFIFFLSFPLFFFIFLPFHSPFPFFSFQEDDTYNEDGTYKLQSRSWKTTKRTRSLLGEVVDETEEEARASNPLPGFVDPFTLEEVVKPAISPSGHVMGLANWIRWLDEHGGVCPFTKGVVSKRELVVLTKGNIEQYRDIIVHD